MTTFNPISGGGDPNGSLVRNSAAGASAAGSAQTAALGASTRAPDVDVAQRLAKKSLDSVPQTNQLLESISGDVSLVESIQQAAGTLSESARKAPAFDVAAVSAALETIAFALEQGREFAEKLKADLPSLKQLSGLSVQTLSDNPQAFAPALGNLQSEATQTRQRLAALAEELSSRTVRIATRSAGSDSAGGAAGAVAAAMQSEVRKGLASVSLPPGGQQQVTSLLADLGIERSASSSSRGTQSVASTTAAVNTLIARLQKQFPDSNS